MLLHHLFANPAIAAPSDLLGAANVLRLPAQATGRIVFARQRSGQGLRAGMEADIPLQGFAELIGDSDIQRDGIEKATPRRVSRCGIIDRIIPRDDTALGAIIGERRVDEIVLIPIIDRDAIADVGAKGKRETESELAIVELRNVAIVQDDLEHCCFSFFFSTV